LYKGHQRTSALFTDRCKEAPVQEGVKTFYPFSWAVELATDLPIGATLELREEYTTDSAAMKSSPGEKDRYRYHVLHIPTKHVRCEIRPAPDAPFKLMGAYVEARATDDRAVNAKEADRVSIESRNCGYIFEIGYRC